MRDPKSHPLADLAAVALAGLVASRQLSEVAERCSKDLDSGQWEPVFVLDDEVRALTPALSYPALKKE